MLGILSSNPPVLNGNRDLCKSKVRHHQSFKLGLKLEYLNISVSIKCMN